jgi:hypothetical protein
MEPEIEVSLRKVCQYSEKDFQEKVSMLREPAIVRGVDLGLAPTLWTPQYLGEKCGSLPAKVHVCPVQKMDFVRRNFAYKLMPDVVLGWDEAPFSWSQDITI